MKELRTRSKNHKTAEKMILENPALKGSNPDVLSEIIDTDIRENLPPQMMAVIHAVFKVIEELDS